MSQENASLVKEAAWAQSTISPEEFVDAGERVVSGFHMKATGLGGVPVERQDAMVWEIRDGKVS
jgi:ketosteroid isomerase-like protein